MVEKYSISRTEVALIFSLAGLGLTFGLAVLAAIFEKRGFERKHVVLGGYAVLTLGTLLTVLTDHQIWAWLAAFPIGAGMGVGYAFILALFSNQVTANKQGWIMGITSALVALGAGIASLVEGVLSGIELKAPLYVAIGLLIIGLALFTAFKAGKAPPTEA